MPARRKGSWVEDQPGRERELDLYQALEMTEQMLRSFRRPAYDEERAAQVRALAAAASARLDRVEAARPTFMRVPWRRLASAAAIVLFRLSEIFEQIGDGLDGGGL